jgi:hypothetical protein
LGRESRDPRRKEAAIRISWERLAAISGVAFVVLWFGAFGLGIEVGPTDREILDYYADSGNRAKEAIAFFSIAGAALALVLFAGALASLIARAEKETSMLAGVAWAGGTAGAALLLAGNAVSRATAFAAMDDEFQLDPNTRRLFEDAGLLLLASGTIAAILLVSAVSLAALRDDLLPRWLAWAGFPAAALLPLAVSFVGFLVLALWVIAVSVALVLRGRSARPHTRAPS